MSPQGLDDWHVAGVVGILREPLHQCLAIRCKPDVTVCAPAEEQLKGIPMAVPPGTIQHRMPACVDGIHISAMFDQQPHDLRIAVSGRVVDRLITAAIEPPRFILATDGELYGRDTPEDRELVRRIQACVAACEGISTEELERGIIADMRRVLAQVVPLLQGRRGRGEAA